MGWIAILRAVLSLANSIAGIVREKQLMDAGAARETALMLRGIAERAGIAQAIEAETAGMTAEEILRDLEGSGELRD